MSRYFCPFCSTRYQFKKTRSDGIFICGQCGDPLMKKPLINLRQIFGLLAVMAFLSPLIIMTFFVVQDFTKEKFQNDSKSIDLLL
tara:strand:- start:52 stop:306 length:255 start_codon:yes stop_codon:yes gene_type:complete